MIKNVLKLILPHANFNRTIKSIPVNMERISKLSKTGAEKDVMATVKSFKQSTKFEQFFRSHYTSTDFCVSDKKWGLLENISQRKGMNIKDVGGIARYDTETVEFLSKLPDEDLLKLQDFIRMKDPLVPQLQAVNSQTLQTLSKMEESQLDFVKKYIQLQNRGHQVFNEEQIIKIAQKGVNEQQINKLIYDGGLFGESILESTAVKNLNVDRLIQEINKSKKSFGKNFGGAHIVRNDYNPENFTLAIFDKSSGKMHMKVLDKDFNIVSNETMFVDSIGIGKQQFTRNNLTALDADAKKELLNFLKNDENTVINLRRISKKGDICSDVTSKASLAEVKNNHEILTKKSQVIKEEVQFIDKDGRQIVETTIPSEVEGVYKIVQKAPDGTVKILGDAKIDPKTGIKTITKNTESLNGTTVDKIITIQPNGNKNINYVIKDADGNVLMDRHLTHTFISPDEAISKINGKTYKILYSQKKISVLDSQSGKMTELNLDELCKDFSSEQRKEMLSVLKQMSGEDLLYVNEKVKNFKFTDNILDSWACYSGDKANVIQTGNNHFSTTHELYHLISQAINARTPKDAINIAKGLGYKKDIVEAYQKELKLFLKHFPEAQLNHVNYFTNQRVAQYSMQEAIAESGALLGSYNNIPLFSIRTEYFERYFPETIARIEANVKYSEPQSISKLTSCTFKGFSNTKKFPKPDVLLNQIPNDKKMKIA